MILGGVGNATAHVEQAGSVDTLNNLKIEFETIPRTPFPGESSFLKFTIQSTAGESLGDLEVEIKIMNDNTILHIFPTFSTNVSIVKEDFEAQYIFVDEGNYEVVVSIADSHSVQSSTDVVSFPIKVTEPTFGTLFTVLILSLITISVTSVLFYARTRMSKN